MADIKIYGKLVANTEDQIVANDNSIQDTTNNQKLNVTLADLNKNVFPIVEITYLTTTMSQLYTNGNRFRIKLNASDVTQYNDYYSVEMSYASGTYTLTLVSLTDPQRRYYANTLVSSNTLHDLFNLHQDSLVDQFALETALTDKQDTLYSGINIKTINGQSILGEGNIEIQGGSGGGSTGGGGLYKHTITFNYDDGNDLQDETITIEMINATSESYGSGATIFDAMLQDYALNPQLSIKVFTSSGTPKYITSVNENQNGVALTYTDSIPFSVQSLNAISLSPQYVTSVPSDTVTPYISGGSGGGGGYVETGEKTHLVISKFTFATSGYFNKFCIKNIMTETQVSSLLNEYNAIVNEVAEAGPYTLPTLTDLDATQINALITAIRTQSTNAMAKFLLGELAYLLYKNDTMVESYIDHTSIGAVTIRAITTSSLSTTSGSKTYITGCEYLSTSNQTVVPATSNIDGQTCEMDSVVKQEISADVTVNGGGGGSATQNIQLKRKLIRVGCVNTQTGLPNGENDTYDATTTYYFYKYVNETEEAQIIANAKNTDPSITTLDGAMQLFATLLNNTAAAAQSPTFSFLAYAMRFDFAERQYNETNHSTETSSNFAEPWVSKGPVFCYMNGYNYIYKMAIMNELGSLVNITPSGTWSYTITEEITDEFQVQGGGGAAVGGSGKLYEIKFDLTRYDVNGDAVAWDTHVGSDYSKLPLSLLIYESNYERFKVKFAEAWAAINPTDPAPNIDTPQQLVSLLNTYVNVKTESYSSMANTRAASLICLTIMNVDKCCFNSIISITVMAYWTIAAGLIVCSGNAHGTSTESFTGLIQEGGDAYDSIYGLDIDNSATLTEYGTSASGGTVEAEPIEIEIGSSDMTAGGKIENSTISNIVKDALENKSIDYIEIEVYENDPNDYVGDIVIRYSNICSNYIKGLDTVVLTAGDYEVGTSSGGSATFISSISIAADKAFEVISNTSGVYIQTGSILGTLITHTLSANKKVKIRLYEADKGGGSGGGDTPSQSESAEMQIWEFTFGVDVSIQVYTKFAQSDLSTMITDTNTNIDTINTMMGISLNHISSFNDIGTLITQSKTIDSTGALTETIIATFMSGLCSNKKTINVLKSDMFVRRTVVNCYPTITNQMATNYNCVVINNQNQFVTLQIDGTNAGATYEEI